MWLRRSPGLRFARRCQIASWNCDELKLVDVTPEDLLQRLQEGKCTCRCGRTRDPQLLSPGNLTALRELALRHTAERVDDQMRTYMQAHAIAGVWPVASASWCCVSGGALSERLIRAARRLADLRHAEWLAVFVETFGFHRLPDAERDRVARAYGWRSDSAARRSRFRASDRRRILRYAERRTYRADRR